MQRVRVLVLVSAAAATGLSVPALPATAGSGYRVTVTCSVPSSQPERQLASNSCLNYLPDGTQTFVAHVRDGSGSPVARVTVQWTDSDSRDAHFRTKQNPCVTTSSGTCSAEILDTHPRAGERVTVTATAGGSSGTGYLTFQQHG